MDNLIQHAQTMAQQKCQPLQAPMKGRIAYIVSHGQSYASNGYAIRTQGIAKAFNQHGFETLCMVRPGRPWELGVEKGTIAPEMVVEGVRYIHSRWSNDQKPRNGIDHLKASVQRFVELCQIYRPEYILAASNYIVGLPAWVAAEQLNIPYHNEVRGFWELSRDAREPGYAKTPVFKQEADRDIFVAKQAQKVFTLNRPMKVELIKRGIPEDKIAIIPNGVAELPEIKPADPALKKLLGIKETDKVVGYIGSHTAYEGLDTLIEACKELVKQQGEPIKLLLVGDNQPLTNTISAKLMPSDEAWLVQAGRVPHEKIGDYYALIDLIVIPRKILPVCQLVPPMKVIEAISYQKSILISSVTPLLEMTRGYPVSVYDEKDNTSNLANAILKSLLNKSGVQCADYTNLQFINHIKKSIFQNSSRGQSVVIKDEVINTSNDTTTTYEFPVSKGVLNINFVFISEEIFEFNKAIFGVKLLGKDNKSIKSESFDLLKYRWSFLYGWYKYLNATVDGQQYIYSIVIPSQVDRCIISIGSKNNCNIKTRKVPDFIFYKNLSWEKQKILSIVSSLKHIYLLTELEDFLSEVGFSYYDINELLTICKEMANTSKILPALYWYLWRFSNDPTLFELASHLLTFQGRMYDSRKLFNEFDEKLNYRNENKSSRRIDDEIRLLENKFFFPGKCKQSIYKLTPNVLYLLHNRLPYNSGGYATRTHGLLTGVVKLGKYFVHGVSRPGYPTDHQKHISKPLPSIIPQFDIIDGIEYHALDQNIRRSSLTISEYVDCYAKEIEKLAKKKKASIIHAAANFPNGLAASIAARRLGIKSVYEVRGLWEITRMSRQKNWDETEQFCYMAKMEAEACNAADAVITITEALKNLMIDRGVDPRKITVVPNCVHTDLFAPLHKDFELANELGISEKDVVIGYVGSIVNYEGLDDLLDALALLLKDGVKDFKFLLVGDGALLDKLKKKVTQLCIENYILITGRIPHEEVPRYYSLVDITPFPRKPYLVCEAVSPLKPFEAMASQKAVLVSSCAALTEIIEDGENGLVFEKGNVMSLKEQLKLLIINTKLREQLAINGRAWVVENRDWSTSSVKIRNIYDVLRLG